MWQLDLTSDLAAGVTMLAAGAFILFFVTHRILCVLPRWAVLSAAGVILSITCYFAICWHGQLGLAHWMPYSNAIVLTNWLPLGAAMLSALVASQAAIPVWRRITIGVLVTTISWYTVGCDLLSTTPPSGISQYRRGFYMQTTPDSCSACCAASLLIEHGISADEMEMMRLCITRNGGTPELGLYRGLKLKTQDTPWDVEILSNTPDSLLDPKNFPVLLLVETNTSDGNDGRFWQYRKANHAVLAYGLTQRNSIKIADPSAGTYTWPMERLRENWFGAGLRLVRRSEDRK